MCNKVLGSLLCLSLTVSIGSINISFVVLSACVVLMSLVTGGAVGTSVGKWVIVKRLNGAFVGYFNFERLLDGDSVGRGVGTCV